MSNSNPRTGVAAPPTPAPRNAVDNASVDSRSRQTIRNRLLIGVIVLLFCGLVAQRVWRYAAFERHPSIPEMPQPISDSNERHLFTTPGGLYSTADIVANGDLLPSQKFRGFQARHDLHPQPGDRLCPITQTKSNRDCTWIVAGQKYEFCCPPCIAEYVRLAKEHPDLVQPPDSYIQK